MNFNLYLFGNPGGKFSQIPDDYIASDIATFQKGLKSSRLVIMRKMDLVHYIYFEKLDNTKYIGFCLIFNHAYVQHPKQLVTMFRNLIEDYLVKKGDIIRYTKEGELQFVIKSFSENPLRYQKLHALIKDKFENAGAQYGVTSLKTIFNGERSSRVVGYNISEEQLVAMASAYNTLIIDDTEGLEQGYIPKIIGELNNTITNLNEQNCKLQKQNESLNRQKKQMKWVVLLLLLILAGGIFFYLFARDTNHLIQTQSDQISEMNDTIVDKNNQISLLNSNINQLKRDTLNRGVSLRRKTSQYNEIKQKMTDINYYLNNTFSAYMYFNSWKSTNHLQSSTSQMIYTFYGYEDDELNIPYYVSSESGYDHLRISLKRNGYSAQELLKESGVKSGTLKHTLYASDSYQLIVSYSKDGSNDRNNDNAGVNQFYIYRPIINRLRRMSEYNPE